VVFFQRDFFKKSRNGIVFIGSWCVPIRQLSIKSFALFSEINEKLVFKRPN